MVLAAGEQAQKAAQAATVCIVCGEKEKKKRKSEAISRLSPEVVSGSCSGADTRRRERRKRERRERKDNSAWFFLEVISQTLIISSEGRRRKLLSLLPLFPPLLHQKHVGKEANWNKDTLGTKTEGNKAADLIRSRCMSLAEPPFYPPPASEPGRERRSALIWCYHGSR